MEVNGTFRQALINFPFMGKGERRPKAKPDTAPAKPLFDWFDDGKGRRRAFVQKTGFSDGRISNWKTRGIPLGIVQRVATGMDTSYEEYLASASKGRKPKAIIAPATPDDDQDRARDAREGILLYLYRGLFSLQQERLIVSLRALFQANQITRKELGQKPLRGVSDDQVRKAFGDAPFLRMRRIEHKARPPRRDPGTAMDDFLEE